MGIFVLRCFSKVIYNKTYNADKNLCITLGCFYAEKFIFKISGEKTVEVAYCISAHWSDQLRLYGKTCRVYGRDR